MSLDAAGMSGAHATVLRLADERLKRQNDDLEAAIRRHPAGCAYVTHKGSRYVDPEPDECCDQDAEPDEDYCALHLLGDDDE